MSSREPGAMQTSIKILELTPAPAPIRELVTKFGGDPVWMGEPMWPKSRSTRRPMRFLCQVQLPPTLRRGGQEFAYIFVTDEAEHIDGTWEPESGENAVILRPGPFEPVVETAPSPTGPTLQARRHARPTLWQALLSKRPRPWVEPVELRVREVEVERNEENLLHTRIGGEPGWLQGDDTPPLTPDGRSWKFLMQIGSTGGAFDVNFGDAGVAYVFLREDGRAARMLWQSL